MKETVFRRVGRASSPIAKTILCLAAIDAAIGAVTRGVSLFDAFGESKREIMALVLAIVLQVAGLCYVFGKKSLGNTLMLVVLYIPFRDAIVKLLLDLVVGSAR
jgi:hypothetical protein